MSTTAEAPKLRRLNRRELITGQRVRGNVYNRSGQIVVRAGEVLTRAHHETLAQRALSGVYVGPDWVTIKPDASATDGSSAELVLALQRKHTPKPGSSRARSHRRHDWKVPLSVTIEERTSTGLRKREIQIITCDLSAGGFGFTYNRFLHPRTLVRVHFDTLPKRPVVEAIVRHCVYIGGGQHRIGVLFGRD